MVHEEVEGLLLPGAPGVLVATEAAQQLDARTVAGRVVGTTTHTHTQVGLTTLVNSPPK